MTPLFPFVVVIPVVDEEMLMSLSKSVVTLLYKSKLTSNLWLNMEKSIPKSPCVVVSQ